MFPKLGPVVHKILKAVSSDTPFVALCIHTAFVLRLHAIINVMILLRFKSSLLPLSVVCLFSFSYTYAQDTNDFINDVVLLSKQKVVQGNFIYKEHITAWDEFGMSALADGSLVSTEINKVINQDITQAVERELSYDEKEAEYLKTSQTTPSEIQDLEGADGSDVPADAMFDPHPSFQENNEASPFSAEEANQNEGSITSQSDNLQAPAETNSTNATSTTPNESDIYKAILQGESSTSGSTQGTTNGTPAESPAITPEPALAPEPAPAPENP